MYVCMYVCKLRIRMGHICNNVCMYLCMYVCMYVCILRIRMDHICNNVCMHAYMYVYIWSVRSDHGKNELVVHKSNKDHFQFMERMN